MTIKQMLYLAFAIMGACGTWYFNYQFILASDGMFSAVDFVKGGFANPASSSLSVDILVAAGAGIVWMLSEAKKLGMKYIWFYIFSAGMIAFAFAFPFFLFMRERHLAASAVEE